MLSRGSWISLPASLSSVLTDVDGRGTDLGVFLAAADLLVLRDGAALVLVPPPEHSWPSEGDRQEALRRGDRLSLPRLQLVPRANCLNWELPVSYGLPSRIIWREPVNRPISAEPPGSDGAVTEQINALLGDADAPGLWHYRSLRLLTTYPELSAADPATRSELEAIVSPLPEGDLADQAAAYLRRLHGECYGDAPAIRGDLTWLEANGFCQSEPCLAPIQPPPPPQPPAGAPWPGGVHGGYPPTGDAPVFVRVFTLLRHLLQQPFDQAEGLPLPEHLIERTEAIPGAYLPSEAATLCKDLEKLLMRNWLFGFGAGIRIDSPEALRNEHRQKLETALAVYQAA